MMKAVAGIEGWTLKGRARVARRALEDGRTARISSIAYRLLGLGMMAVAAGLAVYIASTSSDPLNTPYDEWVGFIMTTVVAGGLGWAFMFRSWMEVGPEGVRVENPLNEAFLPWSSITRVESGGLSLRLSTQRWSVGVFGVEKANREAYATSGAESVAQVLRDEIARRTSGGGDVESGAGMPWRRLWRPWKALAVMACIAAVGWVYYVALDSPPFGR